MLHVLTPPFADEHHEAREAAERQMLGKERVTIDDALDCLRLIRDNGLLDALGIEPIDQGGE